jgi:hypothetical protein
VKKGAFFKLQVQVTFCLCNNNSNNIHNILLALTTKKTSCLKSNDYEREFEVWNLTTQHFISKCPELKKMLIR